MERLERMVGRVCVLLFLMVFIGSCAGMAWSYRTLHYTKLAAEDVDKGIGIFQRTETARCLKEHGTKTTGYAKCITNSLGITKKWTGCEKSDGKTYCQNGAAVGIQNAQKGGLKTLDTVWKTGKGDYTGAVKPALCGLAAFVKLAKDAGVNFKKFDKAISTVLGLAAPLCK